MPIKHKRTNTPGYTWAPTDLAEGQIGLNIADGTLHFKKNNDEIVLIDAGAGGGAADTKTHYGNLFSDPAFKYPLDGSTTPYTLASNERIAIIGTTDLPGTIRSDSGSWIAYNWRDIGSESRYTSGCQTSLVVDRFAVPSARNRGRLMLKIANTPIIEGKKVAVSFYAKADTAGSKMVYGVFSDVNNGAAYVDAAPLFAVATLSTEWQRFSQVFEVPEIAAEWIEGTAGTSIAQFIFAAGPGRYSGLLGTESGRVEITGIQVELNDQVSEFYIVPDELYAAAAGQVSAGGGGSTGITFDAETPLAKEVNKNITVKPNATNSWEVCGVEVTNAAFGSYQNLTAFKTNQSVGSSFGLQMQAGDAGGWDQSASFYLNAAENSQGYPRTTNFEVLKFNPGFYDSGYAESWLTQSATIGLPLLAQKGADTVVAFDTNYASYTFLTSGMIKPVMMLMSGPSAICNFTDPALWESEVFASGQLLYGSSWEFELYFVCGQFSEQSNYTINGFYPTGPNFTSQPKIFKNSVPSWLNTSTGVATCARDNNTSRIYGFKIRNFSGTLVIEFITL